MHQRLAALQRDEPDPAPIEDRQRPGEGVGIEISGRTDERLVTQIAGSSISGILTACSEKGVRCGPVDVVRLRANGK
jgi:hypothetical protein